MTSPSTANSSDGLTPLSARNLKGGDALDFEEGSPDMVIEEDDPNVGGQVVERERTKTLVYTKQLREVKQALRADGTEAPDDLLVDTQQVSKVCFIPVKEGVRWWNLLTIPMVPAIIMLLTTYVSTQTIFLLRNKDFFNIKEENLGYVSSLLVMVGLPTAMLGTIIAGYFFDILGRRATLFITFTLGSAFTLTVPYTSPSVYPWLMIVRTFTTLCLAAPASNPLLADYVHKDAVGKGAALLALGYVVGEVLSMGILFNVTADMSPYDAFMTVAIVGFCCTLLLICLVKEPQLRDSERDPMEFTPERELDEAPADLASGFEPRSEQPLLSAENANGPPEAEASDGTQREKLTEEEFKKLGCCKKLGHINRQLRNACRQNKMFPVLLIGSSVTRLYYVMFSTFWVLYLTSFVGTVLEDDKQVSATYAKLMMCSVIVAISFSPIIGMFTDKVSPRITLPFSFLFRGVSIGLFYFIEDPTHVYAYCVGVLMVLGTTCEAICTDCILMRNADREIRGVIYGTSIGCGYLGQFVLCLFGGYLFDHVGPKAPFMYVGVLDLVFGVAAVILSLCGVIHNDIKERAAKQEALSEKRSKIEKGMARDNIGWQPLASPHGNSIVQPFAIND